MTLWLAIPILIVLAIPALFIVALIIDVWFNGYDDGGL